jgi:hypothetical protein
LIREEEYKDQLTITGSDRPGHIDAELSFKRGVGEYRVEIIVRTRLIADPNRSYAETERLIKAAAVTALQ